MLSNPVSTEPPGWNATTGYTGEKTDPTVGLNLFHARAYDPASATWLSADPRSGSALDSQSQNRYAYVSNNPTSNQDMLGYSSGGFLSGVFGFVAAVTKKVVSVTKTIVKAVQSIAIPWLQSITGTSETLIQTQTGSNGSSPSSGGNGTGTNSGNASGNKPKPKSASGSSTPTARHSSIPATYIPAAQCGGFLSYDRAACTSAQIATQKATEVVQEIDTSKWCDQTCQQAMEYDAILNYHGKAMADIFGTYADLSSATAPLVSLGFGAYLGGATGKYSSGSKGSTGRTAPKSLAEKLAFDEVKSNPNGVQIRVKGGMSDQANGWTAKEGWVKMTQTISATDRGGAVNIEIHYVQNIWTGQTADFKFKDR